MKKNILLIIGSFRKKSFNRQLAQEAEKLLEGRAEISYLEYQDLPYMNQDIEYPAPEAVKRVRQAVEAADGIWIFTPEYNHQIPGGLKNLLDWLSRAVERMDSEKKTAVTAGKPVTVSGAAGKSAASYCMRNLNALLETMRMRVMTENETGIALSREAFMTNELLLTEEDRKRLAAQADAFLAFLDEKH